MKKLVGFLSLVMVIWASIFVIRDSLTTSQAGETPPVAVPTNKTATSDKSVATKKSTASKSTKQLPSVRSSDWELILVSPDQPLEQEVSADQLGVLSNGYQVDRRIIKPYEALTQAAEQAGFSLHMVSAYRSIANQRGVFNQRVSELMNRPEYAERTAAINKAKETMTEPGYSEHHTGLAVDVVDQAWLNSNPPLVLDEGFGTTAGARWLQSNSWRYGFIIRYPENKASITKITYEPWHLRYVGQASAQYITEHNLTLEEYLKLIKK